MHQHIEKDLVLFNYGIVSSFWLDTPGETENEWQKTEQVPIPLLRGARRFFDAKKMKKKNC